VGAWQRWPALPCGTLEVLDVMPELTAARIQGFNQEQDRTGAKVTLDRIFTKIQGEIELALGKDERGWLGLRFDAVNRLHDVLLSLRVLNDVEGNKGDIGLANTVRSFLEDVVRDVGELRHYYEGKDRIERYEIDPSFVRCMCVVLTLYVTVYEVRTLRALS
jgi:hypothetical protein